MSISYEGIGAWCATFAAGTGAEEGKVVKVSANGTVSKCAANDGFCGVVAAMGRDGKACSVQLGGIATVNYSGENAPIPGYGKLSADGRLESARGGRKRRRERCDQRRTQLPCRRGRYDRQDHDHHALREGEK